MDIDDVFRNELASIAPDGRRRWIYARQPSGRFYRARTAVSVVLLAFLVAAPFVHLNGQPLVLLNVVDRRFALVGLYFWPQDFHLVVLLALTALVTLALSTAAVGRIWCGWLCPQTVFMEMVFRKIEYLIDGSAEQQVRRAKGPWTMARIARVGLKQAIFFGLSFLIANLFLAYVIGADALIRIVTDPPTAHLTGLIALTIFSAVFYAVFARFREQACVLACPYGRVMSSLVDHDTVTITYDATRGEPRGRLTRDTPPSPQPDVARGDCVDCHRCVTVCPTGIDIRNGIQLECVACTACADACDEVMRRVNRPEGLIRYTSHAATTGHPARRIPFHILAYAGVWLVLVVSVATLIASRPPLDVTILRQAGSLFGEQPDGAIVNLYTVQIFNRTATDRDLEFAALSPAGAAVQPLGPIGHVTRHGLREGRLLLSLPRTSLTGPVTAVRFEVRSAGMTTQRIESTLIGPGPHDASARAGAGDHE